MSLSVEAKMTKEIWNDSLLVKDSAIFKRLEAKLKSNVSGNVSGIYDYKLIKCCPD